jgi:hypothetical protein
LSAGAQLAFDSAEAKWERTIYQDVPNIASLTINPGQCGNSATIGPVAVDDVLILIEVDSIDGPGSILGQAGPCFVRTVGRLTVAGIMTFDSADAGGLISAGDFDEVVLHEMGHVLGVGSLWDETAVQCLQNPANGVGPTEDTYYSCVDGRAAFDSIGGTAYSGGNKVPVENTGGPGTRNSHWRESVLTNELMTGYLDGGGSNPLSILTVASLGDLGYGVNFAASETYSQAFSAPPGEPATPIDLGNDRWTGPVFEVDPSGTVRGGPVGG